MTIKEKALTLTRWFIAFGTILTLVNLIILYFYHFDVAIFMYFIIGGCITIISIIAFSILLLVKIKDKLVLKLGYSLIGLLLSFLVYFAILIAIPYYFGFSYQD